MPEEALGKRLFRSGRDDLVLEIGRLDGYGLGNCVEGPLLKCLDLFVVRGIRCTDWLSVYQLTQAVELRQWNTSS